MFYSNTILSSISDRKQPFVILLSWLIKFLIPINICSFVFSPYKNKSYFLVPTKFSVSVFSLC